MKIVALMPIKKHSERVWNKNFRKLAAKPLYMWMLDKLVNMDEISQVIINTDAVNSFDLTGYKSSQKVILRERKKELVGDFVSMNKILEDDINSVPADIYLMTHTTNPHLQVTTLTSAIEMYEQFLKDKSYDSIFSVNKLRTRYYDKDVVAINHDPNILQRTQDLEPWFEENSCFYLFTRSSFSKTNARIGEKPYMCETGCIESIDIDEPEDWLIAESIADKFGDKFNLAELKKELKK